MSGHTSFQKGHKDTNPKHDNNKTLNTNEAYEKSNVGVPALNPKDSGALMPKLSYVLCNILNIKEAYETSSVGVPALNPRGNGALNPNLSYIL